LSHWGTLRKRKVCGRNDKKETVLALLAVNAQGRAEMRKLLRKKGSIKPPANNMWRTHT
jgi:hypothetical protein